MFFDDSEEIEDKIDETDYPPSEIDDYDSSSSSGNDDGKQTSDEDDDEDSDAENGFTFYGSELDSDPDDSSYDEDESIGSGSSYECTSKRRRQRAAAAAGTGGAGHGEAAGGGADNDTAHINKVIPFKKESKFLPILETNPLSYFLHFVDDAFLGSVCEHTNKYAEAEYAARRAAGQLPPEEEPWRPLDLAEFKVFIAILLHASLGITTMYHDDTDFMPRYCRRFSENMTHDRFVQILRHLHFTDRQLDLRDVAMAADVVHYFNDKMSASYYPGRELWINNSLVVWRGRVLCRETVRRGFMDKHGLAVDALTEPASGVALRLRLTPSYLELERANGALARLVVGELMHGKLECGHSLYLDPFFCRASVARWLLARGTACTGLAARGRRAAAGAHVVRRARGVLRGAWRPDAGGTCCYLTTEFGAALGAGAMRAPLAVSAYLRATRRDRRAERLRESPGAGLRLRWHKHVFLLVLHMLTRNAYALYVRQCAAAAANAANADADAPPPRRRRLSFFEFRVEVSLAMLPLADDEDDVECDDEDDDVREDDDDSGSESSRRL